MSYIPPVLPTAVEESPIGLVPHPSKFPSQRSEFEIDRSDDKRHNHTQPLSSSATPFLPTDQPQPVNYTAPIYLDPTPTQLGNAPLFQAPGVGGVATPMFILAGHQIHQAAPGYQLLTTNDGQVYLSVSSGGDHQQETGGRQPLLTASLPSNGGSPAQGNSPLLLVRSLEGIQQSPILHHKTKRSASQPASSLQQFRSMQYASLPEGASGGGRGHLDARRYSTPVDGASPRPHMSPSMRNLMQLNEEDVDSQQDNYGGYDLIFLSPQNELDSLKCPICHLIYRNPYLTDCCGACFCYTCINRQLSTGGHCPLCNKSKYNVFVNRAVERSVNCLKVKCPRYELGCTWSGQLNTLSDHNCQYAPVQCELCRSEIPANNLEYHRTAECPKRSYSCKFCSHTGIYEEMPKHWPVCEGYPIPCPNECGRLDMPRKLMSWHLEECPGRRVECQYKFAGCNVILSYSESQKHEHESINNHLALVSDLVKRLSIQLQQQQQKGESEQQQKEIIEREIQSRLRERDNEILLLKQELHHRDEEIQCLQEKLSSLTEFCEEFQTDMSKLKSSVFVPPFHFTVRNFTELRSSSRQWFSQPFYTHPQGYHMCVSVDCNGTDEGTGSHVSVYANLMKGEFDDDLSWPFCGVIVIRLLNQFSDKYHIDHEVPFSRDVPNEISGRVIENDLAESGLGVPQFVSHNKLHYDRYSNVGYLKSDSLNFCILSVKIAGH